MKLLLRFGLPALAIFGLGLVLGALIGATGPGGEVHAYLFGWRAGDVAASRARGDDVVRLLERFRESEGVYPLHLEELHPDHAPWPLPEPAAGNRRWIYRTDREGTWFELGFAAGEFDYPSATWSSERGAWYEDT